jgi:hypothetical protein
MATQTTTLTRAQNYQQISALYINNGWDRIKRHYKYIRTPNKDRTPAKSRKNLNCSTLIAA